MNKQEKWDMTFLQMAQTVSQMSKDPSTKVGSVIVTPDNRHISFGYNGMAAGIEETEEMWNNREIKYEHVLHSEENNLLNCPFDPAGCTIYVTHQPCHKCIIKLAQAKISRIVYVNEYERMKHRDIWDYYAKTFDEVVQKNLP